MLNLLWRFILTNLVRLIFLYFFISLFLRIILHLCCRKDLHHLFRLDKLIVNIYSGFLGILVGLLAVYLSRNISPFCCFCLTLWRCITHCLHLQGLGWIRRNVCLVSWIKILDLLSAIHWNRSLFLSFLHLLRFWIMIIILWKPCRNGGIQWSADWLLPRICIVELRLIFVYRDRGFMIHFCSFWIGFFQWIISRFYRRT